jgi:thiosulfate dehydrogenase
MTSHPQSAGLWLLALALGAGLVGCTNSHSTAPPARPSPLQSSDLPSGPEGSLVHRGKLIFDQTPRFAGAYVGNKLACGDCHIDSGKAAYSAPMIDLANLFPMFNKRAGRVISMQERFQECFTRSENGRPLPSDSTEMKALTAYVNWLSRDGVEGKPYKGRGLVKLPDLTGNPANGKSLYAKQCAGCHGADGAGVPPVLPPVWGPDSYNDGAGMNNPKKMAAFLIHNMPQNHPGTLTPQDAFDVASFIHSMPRPKFNQTYKGF